jgi:imidazolonepropionase-like amidohydrolase
MEGKLMIEYFQVIKLPFGTEPIDLWIVDGKITYSDPGSASGKPTKGYIVPGLVDCHSHITKDNGKKGLPNGSQELVDANRNDHLASGVLLLRDMGLFKAEPPTLTSVEGLPSVIPVSRFIAPEDFKPPRPIVTPPENLTEVALEQVKAGARWVKIFADWPSAPGNNLVPENGLMPDWGSDELNYTAAQLEPAVNAIHKAGARVAVHNFSRDGSAASIQAGVDSLEHGWELDEVLLEEAAKKGTAWTPTLAQAPSFASMAESFNKPEVAVWIKRCMDRFKESKLLQKAVEMNVTILAGTDMLAPGSISNEIMALHEFGLDTSTAIAAATSVARAFLGQPSLVEGGPADFVLFNEDPRVNLEVIQRPNLIVAGGQKAFAGSK